MFWRRKIGPVPLDKARAGYEREVRRCYGSSGMITLAICWSKGFEKFEARPIELGQSNLDLPEATYETQEMGGVVHERFAHERHLPCSICFRGPSEELGSLGNFHLTEVDWDYSPWRSAGQGEVQQGDRCLALKVFLADPKQQLRKALVAALRDAAVSGFRFIHATVGYGILTAEELAQAISDTREHGYGPNRRILNLSIWRSLKLKNSPGWARPSD